MRNDEPEPWATDQGGDPVCWARFVCPECGRFNSPEDGELPDRCGECGAELSA